MLLGRGLAPGRTHRRGGHALEIQVRQNLGIDQVENLLLIATLDLLVGFGRFKHILADAFDQHIRGLVRCHGNIDQAEHAQ